MGDKDELPRQREQQVQRPRGGIKLRVLKEQWALPQGERQLGEAPGLVMQGLPGHKGLGVDSQSTGMHLGRAGRHWIWSPGPGCEAWQVT